MLEAKIDVLTAEIAQTTAAVRALTEALQAAPVAAAPAANPAAAPEAEAEKPKPKRGRGRPKKEEPAPAPEAEAAITIEAFKNEFVSYLGAEKDEQGKQRLVDTVKPILAEVGVSKVTAVEEADRAQALEYLKLLQDAYKAGGLEAAEGVHLPFMSEPEAESVL